MDSSILRRYNSATVLNNTGSGIDGGRDDDSPMEAAAHTTDSVKTDSCGTAYVPVIRGGNASSKLRPGSMSLMQTLERERRETAASRLKGLTLPSRHSPVPSVGATCSTAPVEVPTITRALPKALRPKEPRRPSQLAATLLPTPVFSQQVHHPLASAVDISDSVLRQRRSSFSDFRRGPSSAGDTLPAAYTSTTTERPVRSQQTTSGFRPPPEVVISGPDTIKRGSVGSRSILYESNPGLAMLRKPKEEMTEEERAAELEMEAARRSPTMVRLQSQEATTRSSSHRMSLQVEPSPGLTMLAKIRESKQGKKPEDEIENNPPEIVRSRAPVLISPPHPAAETRSSVTRMSLSTEPTPGLAGLGRPEMYISAEEDEARRSPIMRRIQNCEVSQRGNRMSLQFEPNPGLTMLRKEREENNKSPEVVQSSKTTTSARLPTTPKQEARNGSGRMSFGDSKSFFSAYSSNGDTERVVGPSSFASNPLPTKPKTLTVSQFSSADDAGPTRSAFTPMSAKNSKYRMFSFVDDDDESKSASTTETKNYVTMTSSPPTKEDRKPIAEVHISRNEQDSGYQTSPAERMPSPYETAVRQEDSVRTSSPMSDSWYDPIPASPRVVIRNPHTPSTPARDSVSSISPYSRKSFNFSQDEGSLSGAAAAQPEASTPPALPAALPPTVAAVESERRETIKCQVLVESPATVAPSCAPVFTDSSVYTSVDVSYSAPYHLETVPDRDSDDDDDDDDDRPPPELPTEAPPPIPSSSPPTAFELSRNEADDDEAETATTRWSTSKDAVISPNVYSTGSETQHQAQQQQQQQQQPTGWYARLSYHRATDSNITTDSGYVGRSEHDCFSGHDSSADELDDSRSTTADLSSKDDCCRSPTQNPTSLTLMEQRQMTAVSAAGDQSSRISTDESPDSAIRSAGPLSPTSSDVITTDSEFEDTQLQLIDGMATDDYQEDLQRNDSVINRQTTTTTTTTTTVILHQLLAENGETLDNLLQCQQQQQQDEQREQAPEAESPRELPTTSWKLDDAREMQTFTTWIDNRKATNVERRQSELESQSVSPSTEEMVAPKTVSSSPDVVTANGNVKTTKTTMVCPTTGDSGCTVLNDSVATQRLPDASTAASDAKSAESSVTAELPRGLMNIEIIKGSLGLGFCLEGGVGSATGDRPVTIKRLFRNGPELGDLRAKDEIVAVNGVDFSRLSHFDAWNKLKALPDGTITITVRRN